MTESTVCPSCNGTKLAPSTWCPLDGTVQIPCVGCGGAGTFTSPLGDPALQPSMPDPSDTSAPLAQRARAYLHTNCSNCHRTGGPTPSSMDLRYSTLPSNTNACGVSPSSGDLGIGAAARIIAPGSAANSVLVARMNRRDANGMPPLASGIVDAAGVALLQQWINSLTTCQ